MADTERQLWEAIREDVEADEPRLVYADWADEHGDSDRAEFIRSQVEAANLPYWDPRRGSLTSRAEALYVKNRKAWTKNLKGTHVREYTFERGFLDHIVLNGETSFRYADHLFTAFPTIRSVKINKLRARFDQLMAADWLSSLRILNLTNNSLGAKRTATLATNPRLARLKSLDLRSNKIGSKGLRAVMQSETLAGLERLGIANAQIPSGDVARLAEGPLAAQLIWLEFGGVDVEGNPVAILRDLLATSAFSRLKYLDVDLLVNQGYSLNDALETDTFRQLEHLSLPTVGDQEFEELCNHQNCDNFRSLAFNGFPERARSINTDSNIWNRLEFLSAWTLPFEEEEMAMLKNLRCIHQAESASQRFGLLKSNGVAFIRDYDYNGWQFGENLDFVFGRDGWQSA